MIMRLVAIGIVTLFFASATLGQVFPDLSLPKVSPKVDELNSPPKQVFHPPWWKLDKDITALGTIHGAASLMDGITTRNGVDHGFVETDPLDRQFLGPKPTWARMLTLGSLEVYGTALLAQHMKHSKHKIIRDVYLVPQMGLIGIHAYASSQNVLTLNTFLARSYELHGRGASALFPEEASTPHR
jgi:hypothetical protein